MEDTDIPDGAISEMSRQFQSEDSQNDLISVETGLLSYLELFLFYNCYSSLFSCNKDFIV